MVRTAIARASYAALTIPQFLLILLIKLFKYKSVIDDYEKCASYIRESQKLNGCRLRVSSEVLCALVLAEDHRNGLHYGVDHYGVARSIKVRIFKKQRQGASTIEQQFVRTVTGRYEKTPRRKIREQILAVMINFYASKEEISECYMNCAYYGCNLEGYKGWNSITRDTSDQTAQTIVAYLKYPRTKHPNAVQSRKHGNRVAHISKLLASAPNTTAPVISL